MTPSVFGKKKNLKAEGGIGLTGEKESGEGI